MKKKLISLLIITSIVMVCIFLLFEDKNEYIENSESQDSENSIIVLGSEPESITAAVVGARLGYKVNLITQDNKLGGLFTEGMLTALDLNYLSKGEILHEGFFTEFYDNSSNGFNLDLNKTQEFFDTVTMHENIALVTGVSNIIPLVDKKNNPVGVCYEKNGDVIEIKGSFIFDGSYEAEYTRKLGASYRTGRSEFSKPNEYAAAGVMFSVKGVNWEDVTKEIKKDRDKETGVQGNAAWGFKQMYEYVPKNDEFKMRGLNMSKQDDGSIVLNALLAFGVDPLNENSHKIVIENAKKEIPYIIEYMNANLPGFENASIGLIAEKLYIREGVRIIGEETLDGYDIVAHTKFDDVIGYGSYPSDLQASKKESNGNALNGNSLYEIPLGVMIPKGINNVVVLGKNASFDIVAHGSARTVPVLMSMAQGAVHAVDYALSNNISLLEVREEYMDDVHNKMKEVGKMKIPQMPQNPYEGHFAAKYIKLLRQKGLLTTKYFDNLPLDEEASRYQANGIINLAREYTNIPYSYQQFEFIKNLPEKLEKKDIIFLVSILIDKPYITFEEIKNDNVISEELYKILIETDTLTNAHLYGVLSDYLIYVQSNFVEEIAKENKNIIEIN